MPNLYDQIVDILVNRFDVDRSVVTLDASFDDIHLDSLSQIELSTELKKRFEIDIDDDDVADLVSIGELVKVVDTKISGEDVST